MASEHKLPEGVDENGNFIFNASCSNEEKLSGRLRVSGVVLRDALKTWSDLWKEFRDDEDNYGQVTPTLKNGFTPSCGWEEFLEKMWLLRHYLDYTKRLCEGNP